MTNKELKDLYLGKRVHVIVPGVPYDIDRWGIVKSIDSEGKLHVNGNGPEIVVDPKKDYISLND